jgi:glycogen synthase
MSEPFPRTVLMTADTAGGVWTFAVELARALRPRGVSIALATFGPPLSPTQRGEAAGIPNLHVFQSRYRLHGMPERWDEVDRAGEWLRTLEGQIRPDVIHLNGYLHAALKWQAPVMLTGHSCVFSWWEAVKGTPAPPAWLEYGHRVRRGLAAAQIVAAPTRAMLSRLERHYGRCRPGRVIPDGIHAGPDAPPVKQPIIFASGPVQDEGRNLRALIEAAPGLPWPVFIAGNDRGLPAAVPRMRNVSHCGRLAPDAISQWMGAAAVYCLPARYEAFGFSVLEAAAAGCALVLGDIPELRETWDGAAVFVAPDDRAALHRALRALASDAPLRRAYAGSAQARAARYSAEAMAEGYLGAYGDLLAERPALVSR